MRILGRYWGPAIARSFILRPWLCLAPLLGYCGALATSFRLGQGGWFIQGVGEVHVLSWQSGESWESCWMPMFKCMWYTPTRFFAMFRQQQWCEEAMYLGNKRLLVGGVSKWELAVYGLPATLRLWCFRPIKQFSWSPLEPLDSCTTVRQAAQDQGFLLMCCSRLVVMLFLPFQVPNLRSAICWCLLALWTLGFILLLSQEGPRASAEWVRGFTERIREKRVVFVYAKVFKPSTFMPFRFSSRSGFWDRGTYEPG